MPLSDFLIPFLAIMLAELGDKSQILVFLLASRTKKYFQLIIGVTLGFLVVDGLAIIVGSWVGEIIPALWLKVGTGILFIILGVVMLRLKPDQIQHEPHVRHPILTGFGMILMAEWGDKTQIASALFATKYNIVLVFLGVMSALIILSVLAVYLGKFIAHRVNQRVTTRVAGMIFIAVGLLSLLYRPV